MLGELTATSAGNPTTALIDAVARLGLPFDAQWFPSTPAGGDFFVSQVGSYNKAWGSLAAVIIMLTWLWISCLALLFGAEVNAESERSRELRRAGGTA